MLQKSCVYCVNNSVRGYLYCVILEVLLVFHCFMLHPSSGLIDLDRRQPHWPCDSSEI
jgi:hypothetical protein